MAINEQLFFFSEELIVDILLHPAHTANSAEPFDSCVCFHGLIQVPLACMDPIRKLTKRFSLVMLSSSAGTNKFVTDFSH